MSRSSHARASLAERYVVWLERRAWWVTVAGLLVLAASIFLVTTRLRLFADFSYLLPQDAPAVRDLRLVERRVEPEDLA